MDFEQFWGGLRDIFGSLGIDLTNREFLMCVGVGVLAGWVASQIVGGKSGIIRYLVAGLFGSFLGPIVLGWTGYQFDVGFALANEFIISTIGASVIVLVARILR